MPTKYAREKNLLSLMKAKKDEHIPGIAGVIFGVFLI